MPALGVQCALVNSSVGDIPRGVLM